MTEMMSLHRTITVTPGNYISEEFQSITRHPLLKSRKTNMLKKASKPVLCCKKGFHISQDIFECCLYSVITTGVSELDH